jgi:hypothetical protein
VGNPVPAVAVGNQPYIPTQTVYTGNDRAFGSYEAPKPSYSPPRPVYVPKTSYNPPKPSYSAPSSSYGAPSSSYGAPTSTYNAPAPTYNAPSSSYGAPTSSYGAPTSSFGSSSSNYGVASSGGFSSYQTPKQSFQTGFIDEYSETLRPTREGRLEECYCVPVAQCPVGQVIGGGAGATSTTLKESPPKDYSALINPRVKNTELNITAAEEQLSDDIPVENATQPRQGSRCVRFNVVGSCFKFIL